jgi:hypothetical protein
MEAICTYKVKDTRETVESETHFNTFEVLMAQVDSGQLSFEAAISRYKATELGDLALQNA